MRITPLTDAPKIWAEGLRKAKSLDALKCFSGDHRLIANDAHQRILKLSEADFKEFKSALRKERKGKYMGDEAAQEFACIILPEIIFNVSIIANRFKVPWGLAYLRCRDVGIIYEKIYDGEIIAIRNEKG